MADGEELHLLLTEDGAWEAFVSKAKFPRVGAAALHRALKGLTALLAIADRDRLRKDQQDRKKFLIAFPQLKAEVQEHISHLHTLAEHLEEVHRGCTISNVVADSFSTASDFLGLLGLFLAPVTAEGSLMLSTTGLGLGLAATVTSVATSIVEETGRFLDVVEADNSPWTGRDVLEEAVNSVARIASQIPAREITRYLNALERHAEALSLVRANPQLEEDATTLAATGSIPAHRAGRVRTALQGTPLAMSHRARISSARTQGFSLLQNVHSLVRESEHLYGGAQSELSKALRKLARELEEKLSVLMQLYRSIRSDSN